MAMRDPEEELTLHQIIKAADKLPLDECGQLMKHLELRICDETWDEVVDEYNEKRKVQGLPPVTEEELCTEMFFNGDSEQLEDLKQEIQISLDQLDRGEGIPGEQVFADLKERYKNFKKAAP